jgi:transposase
MSPRWKGVLVGRPHKYPVEFREEAVRLVLDAGRTVRDVADSLEIGPETLRKWVNREKVERGVVAGASRAELEELQALKRENRKLKQQVEILEKATVFFVSRGLDAPK